MNSPPTCTAQAKYGKFLKRCDITVNCSIATKVDRHDFDDYVIRTTKWSLVSSTYKQAQTQAECEAMRLAELQSAFQIAQAERDKMQK